MFVSAWIDQVLNFGERTTNRVESQHSLLKKHLDTNRSKLDNIVQIIDNIVRSQHTHIKASFEDSITRIKHIHRNRTFHLLLTKVSHEALEVLTHEMRRVQAVRQNLESCGCILRTSCGLPCACELCPYVDAGLSIPLQSINIFWKKLNFEPAVSGDDEEEAPTVDLNQHLKDFEQAYNREENTTVKKSWLQKIRAIWDPSSTIYDEPEVQTKTRGRPSTKSKQQNKPDPPPAQPPLQRSYSSRPPRNSSYTPFGERDFGHQPTRHSSFRYSQKDESTTPASFRDSNNIYGYETGHFNYQTPVDTPPVDPPTQPPLHRSYSTRPARHSSYAPSAERDFSHQPTRHSSFRYPQDQDTTTPSSFRDSDDIPGYHSAYVNYEAPGESRPPYNENTYWNPFINQDNFWNPYKNQNTFGFTQPGEPSTCENEDAAAYQTYFSNPSSGPTYDFTNSSGPTEYDFLGVNQHNVGDRKSNDYHNYIDQIPTVFQPHVKDIKNVLGDGNCGFRATAYALGYGEDNWLQIRRMLIDEMVEYKEQYQMAFSEPQYNDVLSTLHWSGTGFAPGNYWMVMPYTGFLIANKFDVIFHFICKEQNNSSTIFPLWKSPTEVPDKKIITIAYVNSNHFVMVEMEGEFPIAITNNLWKQRKWPTAERWERVFKSRQKKYRASLNHGKTKEKPDIQILE